MTRPTFPTRAARLAGTLLAVAALTLPVGAAAPDAPQPGPAADTIRFSAHDVDRAPLDLEAGAIDLYLFGIRTEAAQQLRETPDVQLYTAPALNLSLILNPAPAPEGKLNPFSLIEVRQAMQALVDREFIAQDLYRGAADPMISQVSTSDYDYLTVYDVIRGAGIRFDPEYARERIAAAMTGAGAELVDGVWSYGGEPIRLKFIARVEDERREIGDLIRAELEAAGFQVSMSYQSFAPAVLSVYSTDPAAFEWHLYTEGWSSGGAQRYDVGAVNSFLAPWLGNMPGWQESGFWQYESARLDELGKTLFRGEFASEAERDAIYREMTALGLGQSVRIWLATVRTAFPATAALGGMTRDVISGPRTPYALRTALVDGRTDINVGDLWVWTERTTWNPVGGFGDAYSNDIWRNMVDPAVANDPFTGLTAPFRADYAVETAGPDGTLPVPADAVTWDAAADAWVPVAAGTTARSAVTFDYGRYIGARWHDGSEITMADALYPIAQSFELSYDTEKARTEIALAVTSRPYLETIKGYRIEDDTHLTVYVDYWHFDENEIAGYASPASFSFPWQLLAAMDELVFGQRRAAYSDTAAARQNVPWLSLVMSRDAKLVERSLKQMGMQGAVPAGVFSVAGRELVTEAEAEARVAATLDFLEAHGHLVISSGPYLLERYDAAAQYAELSAFRDPSYPFTAETWRRGDPPTLAIAPLDGVEIGMAGDATIAVTVEGPGTLALRWLLIDPASGLSVAQGDGVAGAAPGTFAGTIAGDDLALLFPGPSQLYLAASSDAIALVTERQADVELIP
ncbi:MAG: ABC transporter substrate-binding protein [Chloroflexota bacterium]